MWCVAQSAVTRRDVLRVPTIMNLLFKLPRPIVSTCTCALISQHGHCYSIAGHLLCRLCMYIRFSINMKEFVNVIKSSGYTHRADLLLCQR